MSFKLHNCEKLVVMRAANLEIISQIVQPFTNLKSLSIMEPQSLQFEPMDFSGIQNLEFLEIEEVESN